MERRGVFQLEKIGQERDEVALAYSMDYISVCVARPCACM